MCPTLRTYMASTACPSCPRPMGGTVLGTPMHVSNLTYVHGLYCMSILSPSDGRDCPRDSHACVQPYVRTWPLLLVRLVPIQWEGLSWDSHACVPPYMASTACPSCPHPMGGTVLGTPMHVSHLTYVHGLYCMSHPMGGTVLGTPMHVSHLTYVHGLYCMSVLSPSNGRDCPRDSHACVQPYVRTWPLLLVHLVPIQWEGLS